jgi:SpoIIAA-like
MANGVVPADVVLGDGVYFNRPGVAIVSWDARSKAAHIEWQGWADPKEFAAANDAIITALRKHHSSRTLGDCRNIRVIRQSDQDWLTRDWVPRALEAGLTRMALVIAKSGLAQMNVEDMLRRVPGTKLDVGYFATVEEATAWLTRAATITPPGLKAAI